MPSALSQGGMSPPAPNPQPDGGQGQPMTAPSALMGAGGPPQGAPQGQQQPPAQPAPTHQQVVAGLKHLGAVEQELSGILADPDLGKTDLRSKIIDGTTRLVAMQILTPTQAVAQLGTVPDRPFEQKQWLETHFAQAIQAQDALLGHHAQAFAGQGVDAPPPPMSDDQLGAQASLASHYRGLKR